MTDHVGPAARIRGLADRVGTAPALAAVIVLLAVVLGGWVLASPIGAAPDDDFHLNSSWCASDARAELCEPAATPLERGIPEPLANVHLCYAKQPTESAACQGDLSAWDGDHVETRRVNSVGAYPPVYYAVMNVFASGDIQLSALLMRAASALLFAGLAVALFLLLPRQHRPALVLGWLVTTVPLGLFMLTSNNPTGWAVLGCGMAWIATAGWFEARSRGRSIALGALAVLSVLVAAGARGDAALYAAVAVGAGALLVFEPSRRFWLRALLLVPMWGLALLIFLSSRQVSSGIQGFSGWRTSGQSTAETVGQAGGVGGVTVPADPMVRLVENVERLPELWMGMFGGGAWGLGWFDVLIAPVSWFCALGACVAVLFAAMGRGGWRKVLVELGLAVMLVVIPLWVLTRSQAVVGREVQPRYILPILVILAGVVVFRRVGTRAFRLHPTQAVLVWGGLTIAHGVALHQTIRRFTTGTDVHGLNLDSAIEWWWSFAPSPMTTAVAAAAAYSMLVALLLLVIDRQARRADAELGGEPAEAVPAGRLA